MLRDWRAALAASAAAITIGILLIGFEARAQAESCSPGIRKSCTASNEPTPDVTSIFPRGGPAAGGTVLTLTGTGFTGATNVTFGGTSAPAFSVNSDTTITVTSPAHAAGLLDIVVVGPGGSSTPNGAVQFAEGIPFIDAIGSSALATATAGPTAGGTLVSLLGGNFTGVVSVSFDGSPGTSLNVTDDSHLQVITPAHGAGVVVPVVTSPAGSSVGGPNFEFIAVCPAAASPTSGPSSGGTLVTVTGWGFTGATGAVFGTGPTVPGTGLSVGGDTQLTIVAPPRDVVGTVPIGVTIPGGTTFCQASFTYASGSAPSVTAVSPGGGPASGGTSVTITGTGFTGATAVTFGGAVGGSVLVFSDTMIATVSPAHAPGAVDVLVTTPSGTSTATPAATFAYGVTPAYETQLAIGAPRQLTFTLDPFVTCASDPDAPAPTDADADCTGADIVLTGGLVLVDGPTVSDGDVADASTVTITVAGNTSGTAALTVKSPWGSTGTPSSFPSGSVVVTVGPAELRHVSSVAGGLTQPVIGGGAAGQTGIVDTAQAVVTRVRGARETACVVAANTGLRVNPVFVWPAVGVQVPLTLFTQLTVTVGGGYGGAQPVGSQSPTFTDPVVFTGDGSNGGLADATCFSWVSTEAGDQHISLTYSGFDSAVRTVEWDTDADGNYTGLVASDRSLIAEWGVLEQSRLPMTASPAGPLNGPNPSASLPLRPNAESGLNELALTGQTRMFDAVFLGSHTTRTASTFTSWLAGVNWTVSLGPGSCGALTGPLNGTTSLTLDGIAGSPAHAAFTAGSTAGTNCTLGSTASIVFTGTEPGPLGSGGLLAATETLTLTFTQADPPQKQAMLAWAGQRVLIEHDWRNPAGDTHDGNPAGTCPFAAPDNVISYVRSSGPGNFIAGLDADNITPDSAEVAVSGASQAGTAPGNAQGACISRVLYESEDPGEVNIDAIPPSNTTAPVAFVVFYMKYEGVTLSPVSQVSKQSHNSALNAQFSPGNPWDASTDGSSPVNWSISTDLLIRGRVRGWFMNATPSGRAMDSSNPLNVLPADRWVLPDDWAVLAGGPADNPSGAPATGVAEQYRPYYDIMFAPNNSTGITMVAPSALAVMDLARVVTLSGIANTASTFAVTSVRNLHPGMSVFIEGGAGIGAAPNSITAVSASPPQVTLGTPLAFIPGDGAIVKSGGGVLFEGPYSLIDILVGGGDYPSVSSLGVENNDISGAAPANTSGSGVLTRDTAFGDGDVNMWDAPMPPALVSVLIRGAGMIRQVHKEDVYYRDWNGTRSFTNPYYVANIPGSPFIPAVIAGGGYYWDSWGSDGPAAASGAWGTSGGAGGQGPYPFWSPIAGLLNYPGTAGVNGTNATGDPTVVPTELAELAAIRIAASDPTLARDLVVYSDNHGEFMVAANGDFKQDYSSCPTNPAGGRNCAPGAGAGIGALSAIADYPDFRGKHFPVLSGPLTINWRWGGYHDVTVEPGDDAQSRYVVVHALDRDGFCAVPTALGTYSLHPALSSVDALASIGTLDPIANTDFGISAGSIVAASGPVTPGVTSVAGLAFNSTLANDPNTTGVREFPLSSKATPGQTDECQAYVKVTNSLLTETLATVTVHTDEGDLRFTRSLFAPAARLTFSGQPTTVSAPGAIIGTPVSVTLVDSNGDPTAVSGISVTITLRGGAPGAVLSCSVGTVAATTNGVASFPGCSVDRAGGSYFLEASASPLLGANSHFFSVQGPLAPATAPSYGNDLVGQAGFSVTGWAPASEPPPSIDVHWFDNANDETGYRVLRYSPGGWINVSGDLPPNTTQYWDVGVTPGEYYAYWIVGLKGAQQQYAPTYITVIASRPAAPVPVAAAAISPTQIRVQWSDTSSYEDGYRVLRYINGIWTNVSGDLPPNTITFVDGLNPQLPLVAGSDYAYWIIGFKGASPVGVIYAPAYVAASTPLIVAANAPVYTGASATDTTATIGWQPAGGSAAADGYRVIRLGAGGWESVSGPSPLPQGTTSFVDTGLSPGYHAYWVYGVNGAAQTYAGSYQTVVTTLPTSPGPISASGAGSGAIHLVWADFATTEEGYEIQRYNGNAWVVVGTVGPGVIEFIDHNGLIAGQTYAYWIVANGGGFSIYAGAYIAATAY